MSEEFKKLIEDFLQTTGIEKKEVENPTVVEIDGIKVIIEEEERDYGNNLVIYTSLGIVPEDKELIAYRAFLEANFFWSGTGDATIGVNSDTKEAIIAYQIGPDFLNGEILAELVHQLASVAFIWKEFLNGLSLSPEETPSEPIMGEGIIKA